MTQGYLSRPNTLIKLLKLNLDVHI